MGPFDLNGTPAVTSIPAPDYSEFSQGIALEGQNQVAHHKGTIALTVDGFSRRFSLGYDTKVDTLDTPRGQRISYLHESGSGRRHHGIMDGLPKGSAAWTGRDGTLFYTKHRNTPKGYSTLQYSAKDLGYWGWDCRCIETYIEHGPITVSSGSPNEGYSELTWSRESSREVVKDRVPMSPHQLPSFVPVPIRRMAKETSRRYMWKRSGLTSKSVSEHTLRNIVEDFTLNIPHTGDELRSYGELSVRALEKLDRIDSNLLESLSEILSVKKLAKSLLNLPKWVNSKKLAGDYLAIKWGMIPMIDDMRQIYNSFSMVAPEVNNQGLVPLNGTDSKSLPWTYLGSPVQCTATRRAHLYIHYDEELVSLSRWLREHGLYPSFENLWDIVPFSFVVDWFINVSKYLSNLGDNSRFGSVNIQVCVYSEKNVHNTSFEVPEVGYAELEYTAYTRFPVREPIHPLYVFDPSNDFTAHKRWLEGAALILQLKKN